MTFDIITLFPEFFEFYLNHSILKKAQEKKIVKINVINLRDFAVDKHKTVDDKPFGGGPGMVMQVGPFHRALTSLRVRTKEGKKSATAKKTRVILTSAKGKIFTQRDAERLSKYDRLVFLCGRYEGVDERVAKHLADEELSIGEYVLTGGELPALVMTDAVARLIPGVLGKAESLVMESHTVSGELEYAQYTRPEKYLVQKKAKGKKQKMWDVPDILLSGDHKKIEEWRRKKS